MVDVVCPHWGVSVIISRRNKPLYCAARAHRTHKHAARVQHTHTTHINMCSTIREPSQPERPARSARALTHTFGLIIQPIAIARRAHTHANKPSSRKRTSAAPAFRFGTVRAQRRRRMCADCFRLGLPATNISRTQAYTTYSIVYTRTHAHTPATYAHACVRSLGSDHSDAARNKANRIEDARATRTRLSGCPFCATRTRAHAMRCARCFHMCADGF